MRRSPGEATDPLPAHFPHLLSPFPSRLPQNQWPRFNRKEEQEIVFLVAERMLSQRKSRNTSSTHACYCDASRPLLSLVHCGIDDDAEEARFGICMVDCTLGSDPHWPPTH